MDAEADDLEASVERAVAQRGRERERFDREVRDTRQTSERLRAAGMDEDADELDAEIDKALAACAPIDAQPEPA
jgi:hypothetical protein